MLWDGSSVVQDLDPKMDCCKVGDDIRKQSSVSAIVYIYNYISFWLMLMM
jgi:hypothetical protein